MGCGTSVSGVPPSIQADEYECRLFPYGRMPTMTESRIPCRVREWRCVFGGQLFINVYDMVDGNIHIHSTRVYTNMEEIHQAKLLSTIPKNIIKTCDHHTHPSEILKYGKCSKCIMRAAMTTIYNEYILYMGTPGETYEQKQIREDVIRTRVRYQKKG